jgi:hypothetical protein
MNEISGAAPAIIGGIIIVIVAVFLVRLAILRFWRSRETF